MPALRGYGRFIRIALRAGPVLALAMALSTLVVAIGPLVGMAIVGSIVGQIPAVIKEGLNSPAGRTATFSAIVLGVVFTIQWGTIAFQTAAGTALADRVDFVLQRQLMASVMAPAGIGHLEDTRVMDLITVGRETFRAWLRPGRLALGMSQLASARLLLVGGCLILARYRWWLGLAMLLAGLWAEYEVQRASRNAAEHHYAGNTLARKTEYYYELGITPDPAKEIRIFGLADFLLERFSSSAHRGMAHAFTGGSKRTLTSAVALITVALGGSAWLTIDAALGHLALKTITIEAQAIMLSLGAVSTGARARLDTGMALGALNRYEAAERAVRPAALPAMPAAGVLPADSLPQREIRFENVTFGYPGTAAPALSGLDLLIPAGRSLAIVGANGAGKTTLVKLLCRLYEPDGGRIRVDGTDLAKVDIASWRRRIAPVFQDHVHYKLTPLSEIGFGFLPAKDDVAGIKEAAADAGVSAALAGLPRGWETVLSAEYKDGVDLSGGEWQKIALARALFAVRHGASVLILDEPAANLDARAEAQLYDRFTTMTEGITTIVISHRFSTVRRAASIAVISEGHVVEQGTHDELLALDGHYAEMFRAQAARFEEAPAPHVEEQVPSS
jgi:ATP-binding cassette subfamily B protein